MVSASGTILKLLNTSVGAGNGTEVELRQFRYDGLRPALKTNDVAAGRSLRQPELRTLHDHAIATGPPQELDGDDWTATSSGGPAA